MKVLIVEDDRGLASALDRLVRLWGGSVECAYDANEGVRALRRDHYDFVLLDVHMPDHDARWFMQNAVVPRGTRVIAMSGYAPAAMLRRLYALGVCAFLLKPFTPDELMGVFERHSRRSAAAPVPALAFGTLCPA